MKRCYKCGETKPVSEFSVCRRNKDGLQSSCKTCAAEYSAANFDRIKKQKAEYQAANRDKIAKQRAGHYVNHREEIAEYHKANRDRVLQRQAEYRANHRKETAEYNAKYNAAHRKRGQNTEQQTAIRS